MAHYLVTARPKEGSLERLRADLDRGAFRELRPFGRALTHSLAGARLRPDGTAVWEEEDYCSPPLAEERAAVLDACFEDLRVRPVAPGAGWQEIAALPRLFPGLE